MSKYNLFLLLILSLTLFTSCSDDENSTDSLSLNISGLEDLGASSIYEGWLIVNGTPVSTGLFSVNSSGIFDNLNTKTIKSVSATDIADLTNPIHISQADVEALERTILVNKSKTLLLDIPPADTKLSGHKSRTQKYMGIFCIFLTTIAGKP